MNRILPDKNNILNIIFSLIIFCFILYSGFSRLHIDAANSSGGNRIHKDSISISQGKHRFGIVSYTHTPNGSAYILVPFAKIGWNTKEQFRRVPVVISALAISVWLLILLRRTRFLFQKFLITGIVFFLVFQPGIREWHQCLHIHSYMFSILFIVITLSLTCKNIKVILLILGFIAGWFSYDWLTVQTVAVLTSRIAFYHFFSETRHDKRRWYLPFLETGLYVAGGILAIAAHICQNALFYKSWTKAWHDLLGTAALRAKIEFGKEWNSGYYNYNSAIIKQKGLDKNRFITILDLWNHFRRLHFPTKNILLIVGGLALYQAWALFINKLPKITLQHILKLFVIVILIVLSGVIWYIMMPWHACCHFHVIYRHIFCPFILLLSLIVFFNKSNTSRFTKRGTIIGSICGVIIMLLLVLLWHNLPRKRPKRQLKTKGVNLLKNGIFKSELSNWSYWQYARQTTNSVTVVEANGLRSIDFALRLENPEAKLLGIAQNVNVVSGAIYRLSGIARSVTTEDPKIIFGGRIGFWLPPQKEKQIVWMSEYNKWWGKELIFTNQVNGHATVYVHMGYGNVSSTGEFTDIRLENISKQKK